MITLPGWSSLDSTSSWTFGLHIAAVAFAVLLGLSEFLAFVYGKRTETLRAIAESVSAEQRKKEIDETNAHHDAEVAELKKKAEEAERKIGAFQKQQADRQLSAEQRNTLVQVLSPFRGQKVAVNCIMGDVEGCRFAEVIKAVFIAAGWDCDGVNQSVYTGGHPVGIEATVSEADVRAGRILKASDALIRTLISLGLSKQGFKNSSVTSGQIEVRVGAKPR